MNESEAFCINTDSTLIVVWFDFAGVTQLLVEGMSLFLWQYLDLRDEDPSSFFLMLQCLVIGHCGFVHMVCDKHRHIALPHAILQRHLVRFLHKVGWESLCSHLKITGELPFSCKRIELCSSNRRLYKGTLWTR
jgi:hypothetical protein